MVYGVFAKRARKLRRKTRAAALFFRKKPLPATTRAAIADAESGKTEAISLDELRAQMNAID